MADFTIQNLPQDVHQALMELAAKMGEAPMQKPVTS